MNFNKNIIISFI